MSYMDDRADGTKTNARAGDTAFAGAK